MLSGYDWGGRAACIGAALWPERCIGLVSRQQLSDPGHREGDETRAAEREVPLWYQWYFQIERGRAGLAADRHGITRILWRQWSPNSRFDEACLERTAVAHDNPDYVDIVIHSYRHRYGLVEGDPRYADIQQQARGLAADHGARAITLDGEGDGVAVATDGALQRGIDLPAGASIAWCRARDTICRRRSPKHSLPRSWS